MSNEHPFEKSYEFKLIEKLADLEKRVTSVGLASKDDSGNIHIPNYIERLLEERAKICVPKKILDMLLGDGLGTALGFINKHNILLSPGEAAYVASGVSTEEAYDMTSNISLNDILSMVKNYPAIAQEDSSGAYDIDDFDVPKHIRVLIKMRGMNPLDLEKTAKDYLETNDIMDTFEITFEDGRHTKVGRKYVAFNKDRLKDMIDDGVIIKIVKIMSSGRKKTVFEKRASYELADVMFAKMVSGNYPP